MKTMTNKERMLAVLQGKDMDRIPFVHYSNLAGQDEDIWKEIGRDSMGILARKAGLIRTETPNCRTETTEVMINGNRGKRTTLYTPAGSLYQEHIYLSDKIGLNTSARHSYYIKEPEDYKVLLAYFNDMVFYSDSKKWIQAYKETGDDGLVLTSAGMRTSYQTLWISWVSMEDMAIHMYDEPELMAEVFDTMQRAQFKAFKAACDTARDLPIPFMHIMDNITGGMIGPNYFQKYCTPCYEKLYELMLEARLDVPIVIHMDGELKPLWDSIGKSKIGMIDSFTPTPDNDTSAADAIRIWPKMRLGLNYPSSVHLAEPDVIYDTAMEILKQAGHTGRLQIQISENMPPEVWRKSFPMIVKALKDFGPVKL